MRVLIVGASGFLGKSVTSQFAAAGHDVLGSYCTNPGELERAVQYTFPEADIEPVLSAHKPDAVVITARLTGDFIEGDVLSFKNSFATAVDQICKHLEGRPAGKLVYVSSDAVFSGKKGRYDENDITEPNTVYGQLQKTAEEVILSRANHNVIVRASYLCGFSKGSLDRRWQSLSTKLQLGTIVKAATNIYKSPVDVNDAAALIIQATLSSFNGIIHAEAPRLNVYQFMEKGLEELGLLDKRRLLQKDGSTEFSDTSLLSVRGQELRRLCTHSPNGTTL